MEHLPVALNAVKLGTVHYDKVRAQAEREFGKKPKDDPHVVDSRTMEEKGYVLRRRSQVQSDEEIVEVVRHKGEVLPRRPRNRRRTSSMNGSSRGGGYRRDVGGYGSDSEGSVPPRGRRARAKSAVNRWRDHSSSSSSTSSSSQLGSSTDEEHEMRKMRRKKWLAAGFATIATVHAGSKIYNNVQAHDKRVLSVARGELSPEDAHKQARKSRWQDAAAIGLAALGVKGAFSEWKEMAEEHEKHRELCEQHEAMHKKRLEHQRKKKARESGGYYKGRDGQWYFDGPALQDSEKRQRRYGSNSTWDTYDQVEGPRNMIEGPRDRKMIEGPPSRARSRSVYNDRSRSRARSSYGGRDRDSDSRSPVRARSRRGSKERRVSANLDDR